MGYQELTIPAGFSLVCVTFKDVAGKDYDLQDVKVYKDGALYENGAGNVIVQKMLLDGDNEGYYDDNQVFTWKKKSVSGKGQVTGWFKVNDYCEGDKAVTLKNGEGLSIKNKLSVDVQLRVSGEVDLVANTMLIPTGFSLVGNMTPLTNDLQDVKVYKNDGVTLYENGAGNVVIQKMLLDGDNEGYYDEDKVYTWKKKSVSGKGMVNGWFKVNTYCEGDNAVSLAPGEAFSIKNKTGDTIMLKFKNPIAD